MSNQNLRNITCDIKEFNNIYEFKTYELGRRCPICKTFYTHLKREYCLHCKKKENLRIKLYDTTKERIGRISKDLTKYSCCCVWGSFHQFAIYWQTIYKSSICKHVLVAIRKIRKKEKR